MRFGPGYEPRQWLIVSSLSEVGNLDPNAPSWLLIRFATFLNAVRAVRKIGVASHTMRLPLLVVALLAAAALASGQQSPAPGFNPALIVPNTTKGQWEAACLDSRQQGANSAGCMQDRSMRGPCVASAQSRRKPLLMHQLATNSFQRCAPALVRRLPRASGEVQP